MTRLLLALAVALSLALSAHSAEASATPPPAAVVQIIEAAAARHGVNQRVLVAVADCETGGTFDPYSVGDYGNSLGLFQLYKWGMLPAFHRLGYTNVWSAWQQADFAALMFSQGYASHWSCYRLIYWGHL